MSTENEDKLERVVAIRGAHRGVLTKLIRECEEIFKIVPIPEEALDRLRTLIGLIQSKEKLLEKFDEDVLTQAKIEDIEHEVEEASLITEKIADTKRKLNNILKKPVNVPHGLKNTVVTEGQPGPSASADIQIDVEQHQVQANMNINEGTSNIMPPAPILMASQQHLIKPRLPKLNLPKFRGDANSYTSFWDIFENAIHKNEGLAVIDKFNYLHSLLEGPAARAIQGLTLTATNYDSAIQILKDRFGRPQHLIATHMEELLKVQACTTDKAKPLRFVYDRIYANIRGLESLGVTSDQYGSLLIPIIMSKLPSDMRLHIARKSPSGAWKIDDLMKVMQTEVEAREVSEGLKTDDKGVQGGSGINSINRSRYQSTASALFAKQDETKGKIQCVYCNEFHFSSSCQKVKNIDQRKEILRKNRRCFLCLQRGHRARECERRKCRKCNGSHHQSICEIEIPNGNDKEKEARKIQESRNESQQNNPEVVNTITNTANNKTQVLLQTAMVYVLNRDHSRKIKARVLLDSGSQRTYITNNLKKKLDLSPVKKEMVHLNTFGEERFKKQSCESVKFNVQGLDGEFQLEVNALSFSVICSPIATCVNVARFPHLDGLVFADDVSGGDKAIDILLGADYYYEIVTGEIIKGEEGPTAVGSRFGWLLTGPVCNSGEGSECVTTNITIHGRGIATQQSDENQVLVDTLKDFWEVESLGIIEREKETPAREFLENIKFNGWRYEVGLPWKDDEDDLVTRDFDLCKGRLKSLLNKLKKDPELFTEYDTIIQEQINNGIVETVPVQEQDASNVHYLPHHGVVRREKETTKLRIVFDGSAKGTDGRCSINDHLETGPNFIPSLFDILVKFRCHPVALTADIEKAFLQVQIKQDDRDKLRFLWVDDHTSKEPKVVQLRFCRLVFGLKPSPAILGATVHHHLMKYEETDPEAVKVLQDLYVDDLPAGAADDNKAFEIYTSTKKIMKDGGFNLRKWKSNSKELTKRINECERVDPSQLQSESPAKSSVVEDDRSYVESVVGSQSNDNGKTKILGINWDTDTDELFFDFSEITSYARQLPPTKRTVLKTAAKFFDPLGFVSPVTVRLKMMFQGLCKDKANWDEELQGESRRQFEGLIAEMQRLSGLAVPRCYFSPIIKPVEIQLHGFSDASERAFAAVVYLRMTYEDGVVDVRLVASKSKVCPMKEQTIPRLELLGGNMLARLTDSVSTALKPNVENIRRFHWTDSSAVLCWIRNEKHWKQYVNQRVREIRNLTAKESWSHCPGVMNPADLPSRGVQVDEMRSNPLWWNGPEFLQLPEDKWPKAPFEENIDKIAVTEIVKQPPTVTHILTSNTSHAKVPDIGTLIDCKRFSSKIRLLRVTAYVMRFIRQLKRRVQARVLERRDETRITDELFASEILEAEKVWIRHVQGTSFTEELKFLANKSKASPPPNVSQFSLYIETDGLMKCSGRVDNASILETGKRPILLPAKHNFTDLVVQEIHHDVKHSGINHTLSTLRERFWVLRGRETVKRNLRKCVICRRYEGKPNTMHNLCHDP